MIFPLSQLGWGTPLALALGTLGIALASCTNPPQPHKIETEAVIHRPRDEAWQRLVAYATTRNLLVNIADANAGTLQATLTSDLIGRHADCGSTHSVTLPDPQGTVTVQLLSSGADTTVTVRVVATDRMWLAESSGEFVRAACTSRGTFEQEIFAELCSSLTKLKWAAF